MSSLEVLVRSMVCLLGLVAAGDLLALETDAPATERLAEPSAGARWSSSYDVSTSDYRLSLGRGALDLGLLFESPGRVRLSDARLVAGFPGPLPVAELPTLSIGLRSTSLGSDGVANSLVDRTFGNRGEAVVKKVGIAWKPAQSRVFLNQGFGIRFRGDDRLTVRLKKGSFALYMRSSF